MKLRRLLAAGLESLPDPGGAAGGSSGGRSHGNATITVVHGIRHAGDVYATAASSGHITQPLSVPAGSSTIDVRKAMRHRPARRSCQRPRLFRPARMSRSWPTCQPPGTRRSCRSSTTPLRSAPGRGCWWSGTPRRHPPWMFMRARPRSSAGWPTGTRPSWPSGRQRAGEGHASGAVQHCHRPCQRPGDRQDGRVVYAIGSASGHTLTAVTQQYPLGSITGQRAGRQRRHGSRPGHAELALRGHRRGQPDARPGGRTPAGAALGTVRPSHWRPRWPATALVAGVLLAGGAAAGHTLTRPPDHNFGAVPAAAPASAAVAARQGAAWRAGAGQRRHRSR